MKYKQYTVIQSTKCKKSPRGAQIIKSYVVHGQIKKKSTRNEYTSEILISFLVWYLYPHLLLSKLKSETDTFICCLCTKMYISV